MSKEMNPITITIASEKTITLTLKEESGLLYDTHSRYHFNRSDKMNDLVSDISLLFLISQRMGNIVFRTIEDWLE